MNEATRASIKNEGALAYQTGLSLKSNPYTEGTVQHVTWSRGYQEERYVSTSNEVGRGYNVSDVNSPDQGLTINTNNLDGDGS